MDQAKNNSNNYNSEINTTSEQPVLTSAASKKFQALIEKFCESLRVEKNSSKHTIRNYKSDLEIFNLWCDQNFIEPKKVTYLQLRKYLSEMHDVEYSKATMNRRLSSLKSFFKWLDITGEYKNNFVSVVTGPKLDKKLPSVVRSKEIDALYKLCQKQIDNAQTSKEKAQSVRDYTIIQLFYATGARISEVAGLNVLDINFIDNTVKYLGKGNKQRIVPIYQECADELKDYVNNHRKILLAKNASTQNSSDTSSDPSNNPASNTLCFIGNSGKPMSADSIRKMFSKYCSLAGIGDNVHPHSMRHTFATDVLNGGADLRSVQEMLGHESLSTTQIYTHLSVKKLQDAHLQAHPRG